MAPEKGNAHSFAAVSALARSCRDSDLAILARFVPRLNGDILIGLMTPHNSQQPDTFIMNCLPLEADVRVQGFPSLSEHATLLPHKQQTAAVDGLIDSLMLTQGAPPCPCLCGSPAGLWYNRRGATCRCGAGCREELAPELTGNPSLHHFLSVIGRLALDPDSKAPATDPLLDLTLDLQADSRRGLQEALPNVLKQFKVAQKVCASPRPASVSQSATTAVQTATGLPARRMKTLPKQQQHQKMHQRRIAPGRSQAPLEGLRKRPPLSPILTACWSRESGMQPLRA